jgi:hypothetical protein
MDTIEDKPVELTIEEKLLEIKKLLANYSGEDPNSEAILMQIINLIDLSSVLGFTIIYP